LKLLTKISVTSGFSIKTSRNSADGFFADEIFKNDNFEHGYMYLISKNGFKKVSY
jgi:hypothetical protein